MQLRNAKWWIGMESSSQSNTKDADDERDDQEKDQSSRWWWRKENDETNVVEVGNTGLGTKHEDEKKVDEEHENWGRMEALCLCEIIGSSVDSHAKSNEEDEKYGCTGSWNEWKQIVGRELYHGRSPSGDGDMDENGEEGENRDWLED